MSTCKMLFQFVLTIWTFETAFNSAFLLIYITYFKGRTMMTSQSCIVVLKFFTTEEHCW